MKSITLCDVILNGVFVKVNVVWKNIVAVFLGVAWISVLAQVSIPLPFTPVPLTLQTFAVLTAASVLGTKRSVASMGIYLLLGIAGAPIYAGGVSGIVPSFGFIVGFVFAAALVGKLASKGWDRKVLSTVGLMILGNVIIYAFGVAYLMGVLHFSVGTAIAVGVVPFLIGDTIKIAAASAIFPNIWKKLT